MSWLHTWAGVWVGALLLAIFWMGTLSVFDAEIDRWMVPSTRIEAKAGLSLDALWARFPAPAGAREWSVALPTERNPVARVRVRTADGRILTRAIDPSDGRTLPDPGSLAGTGFLYPFHVHLHLRALGIGYWIVGFAGMAMLVLAVSGVIIHRRIFADFFLLRMRGNAARGILDLHNATGVLALPFHVMITLSGLVIFLSIYYPGVRAVLYSGNDRAYYSEAFGTNGYVRPRQGRPGAMVALAPVAAEARAHWHGDGASFVSVRHPGDAGAYIQIGRSTEATLPYNRDRIYFDAADGSVLAVYEGVVASRVQRAVAGLHFIQFRHWTLRWLYFLLGLSGCALIATGYLFWLESRRKAHARPGPSDARPTGSRAIEAAAVCSATGIVLATLAFFVANRLLPASAHALGQGRAALEVWAFYLTWIASGGHAWLRPRRAWIEQCRAIAVLALAAVLVNWITTGDHLLHSLRLPHLRPVAGMDLVLAAGALAAALAAHRLARRTGA